MRTSSTVAAGALLLGLALAAGASKPRLRLERIDTSTFASDGDIRVFASVVELEGNVVDDRAGPSFLLKLNGKTVGKPTASKPFLGTGEGLDLVLVVESSALYGPKKAADVPPPPPPPKGQGKGKKGAPALKGAKGAKPAPPTPAARAAMPAPADEPLGKVKDAVHALLEGLSPKVRVLLIDYGGDVTAHQPFRPAPSLDGDVDDLTPDGEAGDLALTKAVNAALLELGKPRAEGHPARQVIVVVSDGLNSQMDHHTFRALGDAAARAHVPVHTIAFSPTDERGPLLNLGEISKRSHGTFRWARTADDLRAQIETLTDEVNKQYVLTYHLDARSLEGKTFQLVSEDLTSNIYAIGDVPVSRALVPLWLWILAGLALGGAAVAVAIARRPKKQMKFSPYRTGQTPGAPQPGAALQPQAAPPPRSQPQAAPPPPARPQPQAAPAVTRGVLVVVSGALAGQRLDVGAQPISIGKGPSTLQIADDPTVSTRHAEVVLRGGAFVVTDLGSTNGTFVNNQRVTQPARLSDGDLLRCGNTQMKFRTE